jgi:hypothetical protein
MLFSSTIHSPLLGKLSRLRLNIYCFENILNFPLDIYLLLPPGCEEQPKDNIPALNKGAIDTHEHNSRRVEAVGNQCQPRATNSRKPAMSKIHADLALCTPVFSTLSCAIRFIATVEIASVFGVARHERKVAKKQKIPEMVRPDERENPPQEKLQNSSDSEIQNATWHASQKIPSSEKVRKRNPQRTQTTNRHFPRRKLANHSCRNRRL